MSHQVSKLEDLLDLCKKWCTFCLILWLWDFDRHKKKKEKKNTKISKTDILRTKGTEVSSIFYPVLLNKIQHNFCPFKNTPYHGISYFEITYTLDNVLTILQNWATHWMEMQSQKCASCMAYQGIPLNYIMIVRKLKITW